MREPTIARDTERGRTGVIETLSAGYVTVNRHPWVLAIPVLLDLFFWLGPRLSLAPFLEQALGGDAAAPFGLAAGTLPNYQETREGLLRAAEGFNLFSLLASHFPGIPSLMAAGEGLGSTVAIADSGAILVLALLLPVVGLGLASVYYVAVGRLVIGAEGSRGLLEQKVWRTWRRLVGLLLLILGVGLLLGIPLGLGVAAGGSAGTSALGFLGAFLWVAALWLQFYLFFLVEALVISDVGPIRAMRYSVAVVKRNTGSALSLVVLVWLITLGMPLVWGALAGNPVGTVVGILGNAYIATGLAAASMIYYRDRVAALNR